MSRNRLGFLATALLAVGLALPAIPAFAADDWVNVATISPTTTLVPQAICYTDGRDIACDSSAGLRIVGGGIAVSGTVSATHFVGDGSGLTGVAANLSETIAINDLSDAASNVVSGSVYLGSGAGAVSTGGFNAGLGIGALASNTTGAYNTASGYRALYNNTTGSYNVANGRNALNTNTTGNYTTAVGYRALYYADGVNNTVAIGGDAGFGVNGVTAFDGGVFVGYGSGMGITTGSWNTFLGSYSGQTTTSGFNNIAIGANVNLPTATSNHALNIGDSIFGNMTNAAASVGGAAKIGINMVTPSVALEVSGTVSATALYVNGVAVTGGGGSVTIAIDDLTDASASALKGSLYMGAGTTATSSATNNTAVGINAMANNASGNSNVAMGTYALRLNTAGNANTANGYAALYNNISDQNVAVGSQAMYQNTTGNKNAVNGYQALYSNTAGSTNTANGYTALYSNLTGSDNVANGNAALYWGKSVTNTVAIGSNSGLGVNAATAFSNGTFVGYASGQAITAGSSNVFIGAWAGATTSNGSSNTLIGTAAYAPTASTNNWLNIANAISGSSASGGSMTFIGGIKANGIVTATYFEGDGSHLTNIPAGSVNLSETIAINDLSDASASVALGSLYMGAGAGGTSSATNNTAVGMNAMGTNTTGQFNMANGWYALYTNSTGSNNVADGYSTLYYNSTGSGNTAVGSQAMRSNNAGSSNTATGTSALYSNTSGINNVAAGFSALYSNSTGNYNVGTGYQTLYLNTTGSRNSAYGTTALRANTTGSDNVANGYQALYLNTTGGSNVANGMNALFYADPVTTTVAIGRNAGLGVNGGTTFANGVFVGYASGQAITTGGNNTFLGAFTGDSVTTGGSNIIIGYNTDAPTATTSNSLNIGNSIFGDMTSAAAGKGGASLIGINWVTPTVALQVSGTVSATRFVGDGSGLTGIAGGAGASTFASLTDVSYSTAAGNIFGPGSLTGATSAVTRTVALGVSALANASNSGYENVGVGFQALYSNTSGNHNNATGAYAMYTNTAGAYNSAYGGMSLYYNTTGGYNTAMGYQSLFHNTSGSNNFGLGYATLNTNTSGSNNVAIGPQALYYANPVTGTVAIGYNAGQGGAGGYSYGTYIGTAAGFGVTTGNNNTFFGAYSGGTVTTGSGNIAIGYNVDIPGAAVSNYLNIGNAISGSMLTGGSMTFIGGIKANGVVTATYFEGDGSRLTGIAGGGSSNEIISGTTKVSTNSNGYISLTTGGVTTGYFDTTGRLIVPSISVTSLSGISVTSATFSGSVGVGTATPGFLPANSVYTKGDLYSDNYVRGWEFGVVNNGGVRWGDWTTYVTGTGGSNIDMAIANQLALRVLPSGRVAIGGLTTTTVSLGVSGTVSATRFVGDGSGLTGIGGGANLSETIAINDLSDASASVVKGSLYMGDNAGVSGGSLNNNTGIGISAIINNSGSQVTALGSSAGYSNTQDYLTAMGYRAGYSNIGAYSTLLGNQAGYSNHTAYMTAVGYQAGYNNIGMYNTTIGASAGLNNNATYVTTLGYQAGKNNVYQNVTLLGYNVQADKDNQVVLGNGSVVEVSTSGVVLAAGVSTSGVVTATYFVGNGSRLTGISGGANLSETIAINDLTDASASTALGSLYMGNGAGGAATGGYNTAVGIGALASATTGDSNVASGYKALASNTTGQYMVANGYKALYTNSTGSKNVGIGYAALYSNTTGLSNIASGYSALYSNTTGNYNSAYGDQALYNNSTGAYNVANGISALYNNTTGFSNIAIGFSALSTNNIGNYNIGIGHSALTANTSGTQNNALGYKALYTAATSTGNNAVGFEALYNNTADKNTAMGDFAMYTNSTGTFSTAYGANALFSNTTGSYNAADGANAMFTNTAGSYSAANGFGALFGNTTGNYNSGFGFKAQYTNTTGDNNLSLGYSANFYGNPVVNSVAVGANAGLGVNGSTAYANGTFLGYASGQGITTGGNNTFLGAFSGDSVTTGGSNIIIGYNADAPTATTSNSLNIGNTIYGDISMKRIGIGVASPTVALQVNGVVSATQFVGDGSLLTGIAGGGGGSEIASGTTKVSTNSNGYISLTTGGTTTGYFDTAGRLIVPGVSVTTMNGISSTNGYYSGSVGIGGTNPSSSLFAYGATPTITLQSSGGTRKMYLRSGKMPSSAESFLALGERISTDTQDADILTVTGSGMVGIGAPEPTYPLVISNTAGSSFGLVLDGSNNYAGIGFYRTGVQQGTIIQEATGNMYYTARTDNVFRAGGATERMRISSAGNVGIGLSSSTVPLAVYLSSNYGMPDATGANNFGSTSKFMWGGGDVIVTHGLASNGTTWQQSSRISDHSANFAFMLNPNGGLVGVGLVTPTAVAGVSLEVSGTVSATRFVGDGSGLTGIAGGGGGSEITSGTTKVSTNSNGYISLTTGGVTTGYFDTSGKLIAPGIGIGVAAPQAGLDITGLGAGGNSLMLRSGDGSAGSGGGTQIRFGYNGTNTYMHSIRTRHNSGAQNGNDIDFWLWNYGVDSPTTTLGSLKVMTIAGTGSVGIGTDTPLATLHVSASTATSVSLLIEGSSGSVSSPRFGFVDTYGGTVSTNPMWAFDNNRDTFRIFRQPTISTAGTVAMVINSATQVAIGKTTPGYKLDVNGQVAGAGAYVNTSDARLKKDVTPIAYGLDTIMKLRPVGFNWIDQSETWKRQHQVGLIAQEVEGVIPEVVSVAGDASQTRSLAYGELVPVLIKAVQDLKGENMELQTQNDQLKGNLKAMQDMLMQQNLRLDALEKRTVH